MTLICCILYFFVLHFFFYCFVLFRLFFAFFSIFLYGYNLTGMLIKYISSTFEYFQYILLCPVSTATYSYGYTPIAIYTHTEIKLFKPFINDKRAAYLPIIVIIIIIGISTYMLLYILNV